MATGGSVWSTPGGLHRAASLGRRGNAGQCAAVLAEPPAGLQVLAITMGLVGPFVFTQLEPPLDEGAPQKAGDGIPHAPAGTVYPLADDPVLSIPLPRWP